MPPARRPIATLGELRERVTIQVPATVLDEVGASTVTYSVMAASVPARVRTVRAPEAEVAERQAMLAFYEVTIMSRPGILPTYRLLWRGRALQIVDMRQPDEQRRFLVLGCRDAEPNPGSI